MLLCKILKNASLMTGRRKGIALKEEKKYSNKEDCRKARGIEHCCVCSTASCPFRDSHRSSDVTAKAVSFGSPKESGVLDFRMWGVVV
jgi:hypothetical protein